MDHSPTRGGNVAGCLARTDKNELASRSSVLHTGGYSLSRSRIYQVLTLLLAACAPLFALRAVGLELHRKSTLATSITYLQVVNPADPGITWTAPAPIPLGTALGPTQLSATAAVPGRFLYTPSAGTLLNSGIYTLSVTFTPASTNFAMASANVSLTVEPPPNGSTFQLQLGSSSQPAASIQLNAAQHASAILSVVPVGNFQQPVTLACTAPPGLTCTAQPASVRPTTAPASVMIQIASAPATKPLAALSVWVFLAASLRAITWVGRGSSRGLALLSLTTLLWLPIYTLATGCVASESGEVLIIQASSLSETKSLEIPLIPYR
jgi:hypothetical protein